MFAIFFSTFIFFCKYNNNVIKRYANVHNDPFKDDKILKVFDGKSFLSDSEYNNLLNNIPKLPEHENEIIEDSFEGFLRNEFNKISHKNRENINVIDFKTFVKWRKKVGTLFYDSELKEFYYSITDKYLNLMQFIKLNNIIDENDGAKF